MSHEGRSWRARSAGTVAGIAAALLLAGCGGEAHYPINPRLAHHDPNAG